MPIINYVNSILPFMMRTINAEVRLKNVTHLRLHVCVKVLNVYPDLQPESHFPPPTVQTGVAQFGSQAKHSESSDTTRSEVSSPYFALNKI